MINTSDLTERIIIRSSTEASDANYGGSVLTWSTVVTLWANVQIQSGREFYGAKRTNAELDGIVKIRDYPGITPQMRVQWLGNDYDIIAVIPIRKPGAREIELHVKKVV